MKEREREKTKTSFRRGKDFFFFFLLHDDVRMPSDAPCQQYIVQPFCRYCATTRPPKTLTICTHDIMTGERYSSRKSHRLAGEEIFLFRNSGQNPLALKFQGKLSCRRYFSLKNLRAVKMLNKIKEMKEKKKKGSQSLNGTYTLNSGPHLESVRTE